MSYCTYMYDHSKSGSWQAVECTKSKLGENDMFICMIMLNITVWYQMGARTSSACLWTSPCGVRTPTTLWSPSGSGPGDSPSWRRGQASAGLRACHPSRRRAPPTTPAVPWGKLLSCRKQRYFKLLKMNSTTVESRYKEVGYNKTLV